MVDWYGKQRATHFQHFSTFYASSKKSCYYLGALWMIQRSKADTKMCAYHYIHCINWIEWKAIIFISNNTYGRLAAWECLRVYRLLSNVCMYFVCVQRRLQWNGVVSGAQQTDQKEYTNACCACSLWLRAASQCNGLRTTTASNDFINQSNGMWLCCARAPGLSKSNISVMSHKSDPFAMTPSLICSFTNGSGSSAHLGRLLFSHI